MPALGVNAPHAVAFETAVGKTVQWCRAYSQNQNWATGTTGWADTIAADARGQNTILSFKSSFSWAQVASGSDDARLTAIANGLMANTDLPGIISFNHEPENDGGIAADFKAASAHVRAVMAPLMPGWRFGPCLILDTFRTGSGRHPDDWVHTSSDVLLVDGYNWRDADTFGGGWADPSVSDRTPASIFGTNINSADYAEALGMDFGFAEIGCSREQADTTGTERTAWWNDFADYVEGLAASKCEMICHFEKNTSAVTAGDGGVVNWAIRSEPASATAFARLLTSEAVTLPAGVTTVSGTTTWTDEHIVPVGATLRFDANNTTTLIMDNKNLVVYGELEMHPASASIIHTVRFINVNEQAYVGAPAPTYAGPNMGSMTPSATDIGLWVLDHGILDAIGTPRAGWNRTGDDPTWLSTDDMRTVPFNQLDYTTFAPHTKGGPLLSVSPGNGETYVQECFNITRNVRFEGTVGHRAHVLIMTPGVAQVIKYARFENLGPRHIFPDGSTGIVRGRWSGIHFHHLMETVGTLAEGIVVVNGTGHAFVSHDSHRTTMRDCIAFNTIDDAYWWDDEYALKDPTNPNPDSNSDKGLAADQASFGVTYDHCMAARTYAASGESSANMVGFSLLPGSFGTGFQNFITDCVAVGNQGTSSAAGYNWPEAGSGDWVNSGCVSHNNAGRGVYFWQNNGAHHVLSDFVCFRNGLGGFTNGAYVNNVHYTNCVAFENSGGGDVSTDFVDAAGGHSIASPNWHQNIQDCWFGDFGIIHHVATTPGSKVIIRDNHLGDFRIDEWRIPGGVNFKHAEYLFIHNDLQEPEDFCNLAHPHAGNHKWIYAMNGLHPAQPKPSTGDATPTYIAVQRSDNTAWQAKQVTGSNTDWTALTLPPIWFYITTSTLAAATKNVIYNQALGRVFGQTNYLPFTWRLKSGSGPLPTGLTLGAHPDGIQGLISGTPTVDGSFPITVEIVNAHGDTSIPSDFTLVVGTGASLQITTSSLPNGFVGTSYSQTLVATGGTGAGKIWTLVSGTMPPGIGLSSGGVISGTPTTIGNSSFTVRVTDGGGNTVTKAFSILISAVNPSITTDTPLPTGAVGATQGVYVSGLSLEATGGAPPYTWSVVSGAVPTGLTLSSAGVISGTPTTATAGAFTARATDSTAHTGDKAFTLPVVAGVSFLNTTASQGTTGVDYTTTFTAQNGIPPYEFAEGNNEPLPGGLSLSSGGVLSGTPTAPGTYIFQIIVEDSVGTTAQTNITLVITIRGFKVRRALAMRGSSRYKPVA
jgi:hypothetical protein